MKWSRVKPRIWHHHYLALRVNRQTLELARKALPDHARVLDMGCGAQVFRPLFPHARYVGTDIEISAAPELVVADNCRLPFRSGTFDLVIASETIEHTRQYELAVDEMKRVLAPGGLVFISAPFAYPLHEAPRDFQRITRFRLLDLFHDFDILQLTPSNTLFSAWLIALEYLFSSVLSITPRPFSTFSYVFSSVFNLSALCLDAGARFVAARLSSEKHFRSFARRRGYTGGPVEMISTMPAGYAFLAAKPILLSTVEALR